MEEFLRVNVEVVMFFALAEELLFQPVPAFVQIFAHFKMLRAQIVERSSASLEMILQHYCHLLLYYYSAL